MVSKCIGIISYFPDSNIREKRIKAFEKLLFDIGRLFPSVDILVIAQNWKEYLPTSNNNKLLIYNYKNGLGILPARIVLRNVFLSLNYDYVIMLDDDCIFRGTSGQKYLEEIDEHPDMMGIYSDHLLKLLAISKSMYSKVEMVNLNAESGEGFEDKAFIQMCMNKYPEKCFMFSHTEELNEISYGFNSSDYPSTWWNNHFRQIRNSMVSNTNSFIDSYKVNGSIDIVIPWVNPTEKWISLKNKFEKEEKINKKKDFNGESRYRDWGFFPLWFRGIEKYCPWLRYIYLILQDESQIPQWLNINHPKLKIIYHREYIPEELLPTFNSNTLELYIPRINEVSKNYILCNDDTYFFNYTSESDYM